MRSLSPALASLANVFRIPMSLTPVRPAVSRVCHETLSRQSAPTTAAVQTAPFSSTSTLAKRKGGGPQVDKRISTSCPLCYPTIPSHTSTKLSSSPELSNKNQRRTQKLTKCNYSSHPLLPLPPPNPAPAPLLPQPLPPPLDHPPRLATIPGAAAQEAGTRAAAPVPEYAGCVRGAAHGCRRWREIVPRLNEQEGRVYGSVSH